jgi:hypothetical protein
VGEGEDYLHGGWGRDAIDGYTGKDQVGATGGNDRIETGFFDRNGFRTGDGGVVASVACGFGTETVCYEKGRDRINSDCEKKVRYYSEGRGHAPRSLFLPVRTFSQLPFLCCVRAQRTPWKPDPLFTKYVEGGSQQFGRSKGNKKVGARTPRPSLPLSRAPVNGSFGLF